VLSLSAWVAAAAAAITVLRAAVVVPDGQPLTAALEIIRRVALAGAWYVLGITALSTLTRAVRVDALVALADALTVLPLRGAVRGALGAGLAGTLVLSAPSLAGAGVDDPPIVTLRRLPAPGAAATTSTTTTIVLRPPPTTSTTTRPPPTWAPTWAPNGPPPAAPVRPPRPPAVPTLDVTADAPTWRVARGQCFWTIAEAVVSARRGRPVLDREIVPYWRLLIAANRSRLRDPANPDLIFPGQVFIVP